MPKQSHHPKYQARALDGVLVLDKPTGVSSNRVLQDVRHLYQAKKAGHGGTLDPLATGLLLICFGRATRLLRFLLESDKSYDVEACLGVMTDTGDACGEVIETNPVSLDEKSVRNALNQVDGVISQVPPMYSALKHKGRPLHALARQGIEIERKPRQVTIYASHFQSYDAGTHRLSFSVDCSKGTYVRTLVEDLGKTLECGAHVTALRRTASGPFNQNNMVSLDALQNHRGDLKTLDAYLLSPDYLVADLPEVTLPHAIFTQLLQGQNPELPPLPAHGSWTRLLSEDGELMGVGECHVGKRPLSSIIWLDPNGMC